MPSPNAPSGLKTKGRAMWRGITSAYELRPDELRLLEEACREVDLIARIDADIRDAPLTVKGSMGQTVSAPGIQEIRQHRMTLARLLGQLKLPDSAASGEVKGERSASARQLAAARWGRRGA